jgi:hypothetical protein
MSISHEIGNKTSLDLTELPASPKPTRDFIQAKRIQSSQIHSVGAKSIELFRGVSHCDYRDLALHKRLLDQLAGSLVEGACTFIEQQNGGQWLKKHAVPGHPTKLTTADRTCCLPSPISAQ